MNSGTHLTDYNGISYVDKEEIRAQRGLIYDTNGAILAENVDAWDVIAYISANRPSNKKGIYYVADKEMTAAALAPILECDEQELLSLLRRDSFMTYLGTAGRGISTEQKEAIEALNLPGIEFVKVVARNYPFTPFSSHLIGFARYTYVEDGGQNDLDGKTGLEASLNNYLSGTPGYTSYYKDTGGNALVGQQVEYVSAINGNDVYLTLDNRIQTALQQTLKSSHKSGTRSKYAWGIVLEAKTGKILAYDTYPTYDQNDVNVKDYLDFNTMATFEPGSIMKPFTYAAAIDQGKFSPDDTFDSREYYLSTNKEGKIIRVNKGAKHIAIIRNNQRLSYGTINFWVGFAKSCNTGAVTLLEKYVDQDIYKEYMENFGFYKTVGSYGIANEAEGVENLTHPLDIAISTYGQGCSYTGLQIMQGYTAFCNGGEMLKPYIIDKVVDSHSGEVVYQGGREVVGTPIKPETAETVLQLMEFTANSGENTSAKKYTLHDGITLGDKTGTAEAIENGSYSSGLTIHSIVVTMPAVNPQYLVYVAYEDYNSLANNQEYVRDLENVIATTYGLYNLPNESDDPEVTDRQIYANGMPSFINHTPKFAEKMADEYGFKATILGSGSTVLAQYPLPDATVISGQRVLLLTSSNGISMPNMKGWSRKELIAFWNLTGIEVTIRGSGFVKAQNIKAGQPIDNTSQIGVDLE